MAKQETFTLVSTERLDQMERTLQMLYERIEGATIVPPPEWLSIKDAAEAMGVSTDTVRRRIDAGALEARGSGKLRQVKVPHSSRRAVSSASSSK